MGIDIRDHGSGGAGATNALRVMGRKAGAVVLVADVLKAIVAFSICTLIWNGGGTFFGDGSVLPGLYGTVGVILGHCFPFYLKFKGGKGFASAVGLVLSLDIRLFLIGTVIWLAIVFATKYVSLATLAATLMMPIVLHLLGYSVEVVLLTSFTAVLIWFLHRKNIGRLLNGVENKISLK
jgi:glycerol-3-phosphate acyltransferase PlsY